MDKNNSFFEMLAEKSRKQILKEHEYDYRSGNPAVYCGTYGKYNDGSIDGMWLDLTDFSDYDEFIEFCEFLHMDEEDPEFMFQDYENFPRKWYSEGCFYEEDFDAIIEWAELSDDDKEMLEAYQDAIDSDADIEEAREHFFMKQENDYDLAWRYLEESDCPEHWRNFIDIKHLQHELEFDFTIYNNFVFSH